VALVAAALATACGSASGPVVARPVAVTPPGATPAPPGGTPEPIDPATLAAFVPEAERFVEEHRGLRFTAPVKVRLLDDAAFRARNGDGGIDPVVADELHALQLVPRSVDLIAASKRSDSEGVVGVYQSRSKELLVRGSAPNPFVREVLVHELTHALQDQWFGIDRPALDAADDERSEAFTAVVEGDAVRIEDEYVASLPAGERRRVRLLEDAVTGIRGSIPGPLRELDLFPYISGPDFVRALAATRGNAGVDAAFRTPPTTSAEVMEPQRYLGGVAGATTVPVPAAGGASIDHGILGEFGLHLLMERASGTGAVSDADADATTRAWHGDAYVAWSRGTLTCERVTLAAAPGPSHDLVERVLSAYAARVSGVTVTAAPSTVTLTSCG
jgi:hypothetical protein